MNFIFCPKCGIGIIPIISTSQPFYWCLCGYDSRKLTYSIQGTTNEEKRINDIQFNYNYTKVETLSQNHYTTYLTKCK